MKPSPTTNNQFIDLSAYTPGSLGYQQLEKRLKADIEANKELSAIYKVAHNLSDPSSIHKKIIGYQINSLQKQLGFSTANLNQLYGLKKETDKTFETNRFIGYLIRKFRERQTDFHIKRLQKLKRIQRILMMERKLKRAKMRARAAKLQEEDDEIFEEMRIEAEERARAIAAEKAASDAINSRIETFIEHAHELENRLEEMRDEYGYLAESNPEIYSLIEEALEAIFAQMQEIESLIFENDNSDISPEERRKIDAKISEYSASNQNMLTAMMEPFKDLMQLKAKLELVVAGFKEEALHYVDAILPNHIAHTHTKDAEQLPPAGPLTFSSGLSNHKTDAAELRTKTAEKDKEQTRYKKSL